MINFRYHVISLIAVFLALAIGVIMGSAVIDRAIVDRLEEQQEGLREDIREVEVTNDQLRAENAELRETAEQLTEEGSQRLLAGSLADVPVLVIATRGVEGDEGFEALLSLLGTSGADQQGTLWLTERFALDDEDEVRDLVEAIDAPSSLAVETLRSLALTRLSTALRGQAGAADADDEAPTESEAEAATEGEAEPPTEGEDGDPTEEDDPSVVAALRDAGFVDFDAPEGQSGEEGPVLAEGTRLVLLSGQNAEVPPELVAVPLAGLLVDERPNVPMVSVLAAEARSVVEEPAAEFVVLLREADEVAARLSTLDNIDDFAGRLAAVLALVDLGEDRVGHFGLGPGAQRLLPAPPESDG